MAVCHNKPSTRRATYLVIPCETNLITIVKLLKNSIASLQFRLRPLSTFDTAGSVCRSQGNTALRRADLSVWLLMQATALGEEAGVCHGGSYWADAAG